MRECIWGKTIAPMLLTILLVAGCQKEHSVTEEVADTQEVPVSATEQKISLPTPNKQDDAHEAELPELAHGTHMVFGIRMPRGMIPISAGDKVKRFEGTHSIESVKRYLVKQLAGNVDIRANKFGEGFFISNAIPASSQRNLAHVDTSVQRLNIKIFEGSLGGAGVDVWAAIPGESIAEGASSATGTTLKNLIGKQKKEQKTDAAKINFNHPRKREKATFKVFDKLSKGQPLTEEDYQSPFFTEQ